jgi:hypothetical protein
VNPHEELQNLARQLYANATQQTFESESVEEYAMRRRWVEATWDQLGEDFFVDLLIALGDSCSGEEGRSNTEQVIRMLQVALKEVAEYAERPTDTAQRRDLELRLQVIARDARYVLQKLTPVSKIEEER